MEVKAIKILDNLFAIDLEGEESRVNEDTYLLVRRNYPGLEFTLIGTATGETLLNMAKVSPVYSTLYDVTFMDLRVESLDIQEV